MICLSFPGSSAGKVSACNAGDPSSIPGRGRSPGAGIGLPLQYLWAFLVAQMVENPPAMLETRFHPWVGEIPWRRAWQTTSVFLLGKSHGQRSLTGYSLWGYKGLDMAEQISPAQCSDLFKLYLEQNKPNKKYLFKGQVHVIFFFNIIFF